MGDEIALDSTLRLVATHLPLHLPVRAFETISNLTGLSTVHLHTPYISQSTTCNAREIHQKKRESVCVCEWVYVTMSVATT